MVELTQRQKKAIEEHVGGYKKFLKIEEGQDFQKEREKRITFFQKRLNEENLDRMSENVFGEVIKNLWASQIWGNKQYLVDKLLSDNGLQKIREELKNLLYGSESINKRFDRFKNSVGGLGPSSVTEILAHVFPNKYCMWNEKPKTVLPFLGMKELLPDRVYKYQINGDEYAKCNEVLGLIRDELKTSDIENPNFMDVDYFLFFIFDKVLPKFPPEEKKALKFVAHIEGETKIKSHEDAQGILVELGNLLGYDTYVADPSKRYGDKTLGDLARLERLPAFTYKEILDVAKNIDVIWFKEEFPHCCFEVEHTTNVKDGLLRLYQMSPLQGIKFFIVAPADIYPKFEREVTNRPFRGIKSRYNFKSYEELIEFFRSAKIHYELKRSFLGE